MSLFYSSRFSTKVFSFFGVVYETTRWSGQRIGAISMRFCYYGASGVQERFCEVESLGL